MGFAPGARLGPYEIVAPLGAGGMGEVYRAKDTRLGRDVAVKVLPESLARDSDRMRRFEQEARSVAALNHPNVLSVYDIGTHEGVPYLVSELLEGGTLRRQLEEGSIPPRKAVEWARQAADGLAAAHDKNIVHRDLKPENLFVTTSGRIKILDFGLAKVQVPLAGSSGDTATATIGAVTSPGIIMGIAGYMAPEQVRGEAVDHRADIFSFGAVFYEMLTGRRAFLGESAVETLNSILKEDPPELAENAPVPAGLERTVRHCLEKKPADRFQSARDLMFALESVSDTGATRALPVPPASSRREAKIAIGTLAALLLAGAASFWFAYRGGRPPERAEFGIAVPGEVSHLSLSADGKWLAFVSPDEASGAPVVFVQRVGTRVARGIPGSEGASYPFWSPDDAYVAFFAQGKLRKAALSGGDPQTLATTGIAPRGGSWSRKGVILFARDSGGPIWRVNADGSGVMPATEKILTAKEASHRWPAFLPDGDHFLMYAGSFSERRDQGDGIYLSSLSKLDKILLNQEESSAAYSNGRMYYTDAAGALMSSRLDVSNGKLSGAPRVIAPRVAHYPSTYYSTFAVSEDGTLVYGAENVTNHSQLTWFDRAGKELSRVGPIGVMANPALSPDGRRVAFDSNDFKANNVDLWLFDLATNGASRFTFDPAEEVAPAWSRAGTTIAYRSISHAAPNIQLKKASGLEAEKSLQPVTDVGFDIVPNSWAPGDQEILCVLQNPKANDELILQPVSGGKPRTFLKGSGNLSNGQISPDGKWVAYASNETGDWEIYVTTFPGANGKWQVSRGGGSEPRWRGDGKAIFFLGPKGVLTQTDVTTEGTFATIGEHGLFSIRPRPPISSTDIVTYDVTRDGQRFLVNQYVKPERVPPLSIILNEGGAAPK